MATRSSSRNRAKGSSPAPVSSSESRGRKSNISSTSTMVMVDAPSPRSSSRSRKGSAAATARPAIAGSGRPSLPLLLANTLIKVPGAKTFPVKEQTLDLEKERLVIARQKIPTPKGISGHVIRRTDTNGVSASSMFRSAFPECSDEDEATEMEWLRTQHNTIAAGREHDPNGKLTGTWIPTQDAFALAAEYDILRFAKDLFEHDISAHYTAPAIEVADNDMAADNQPEVASRNVEIPESPAVSEQSAGSTTPASTRASKRQRKEQPEAATSPLIVRSDPSLVSGIVVEQEIVQDPVTGDNMETNTVTLPDSAMPLARSAAAVEESIKKAKELVEAMKQEHLLSESSSKKHKRKSSSMDLEQPLVKRGSWLARTRPVVAIRQAQTEPVTPARRRMIGFVGLTLVGAATAVAPYLFG